MAGRKIHAGGKVYTPEEFVCEWCKTPLVLDTYYTIDGKNVCQSCRNKERCASCGFLITETKYVTVDDKTYHPDCFRCSECLIELERKFHLEDGALFCSECIALKGSSDPEDMCPKCFLPLSGGIIKALGKRYHEDCFVCHSCFGEFPNDEFVNIKGNPFCDNCVDNESYLRSTAHLKATGQDPSRSGAGAGAGSGGYGAGSGSGAGGPSSGSGSGSGSGGYGADRGAPGSGTGGYGSGSGAGGPGAGGYGSGSGAGGPGSGGYGSGSGAGGPGSGSGAGGPGAGGYGSGSGAGGPGSGSGSGYGADRGAPGSGGSGSGAGGPGGYGSGAGGPGSGSGAGSRGVPETRSVNTPDDEYVTVVENSYLDPTGLPPKGPSKFDQKTKSKYGGGMKEEKRQRDYKSKAALGFCSETEHLKDMESLGYKTIRKK